jgi:glutaredoxin
MKPTSLLSHRPARWAASVVLVTLASSSLAQQVFRIVGPDGRVTFSDRPPPPGSANRIEPVAAVANNAQATPAATSTAALPLVLREPASRFPVTLYTGNNCAPCESARALLVSRGIPFSERTVTTAQDLDAMRRLSGDLALPMATIGGQQLKGFSDAEWTQYLDAAGYPKSSALPAGFRQSPPAPLVAVQAPPAPATAPTTAGVGNNAGEQATPIRRSERATNPTGIQF